MLKSMINIDLSVWPLAYIKMLGERLGEGTGRDFFFLLKGGVGVS